MRLHLLIVAPAALLATARAEAQTSFDTFAPAGALQGAAPDAPTAPAAATAKAVATVQTKPPAPGTSVAPANEKGLGERIAGCGMITFGTLYLGSVLAAAVELVAHGNRGYAHLFIPIGGPFSTMSSIHPTSASKVWLGINGGLQAAGVAALFGGVVVASAMQPSPRPASSAPTVAVGPGTIAVAWRF
jgi:hypothetical protein